MQPSDHFSVPLCRHATTVAALLVAVLLIVPVAAAFASVGRESADLRYQLTNAAQSWGGSRFDWKSLDAFYAQRHYRPVWCGPGGLKARAQLLLATLSHAGREGLNPDEYHVDSAEAQCGQHSPAQAAWVDILLTNAFFGYSRDVSSGNPELRKTDPSWFISAPVVNPAKVLESALSSNADFARTLAQLPPPQPAYRRLQAALARYRHLAAEGQWPDLPPGPALKEGVHDPQVALLRRRLALSGDLPAAAVSGKTTFGPHLKAAVERFQRRYGLAVDGIVGPLTRAALDVPPAARVEQIRLNMERWRWLPRHLGSRYIMVNLAGFRLRVVDHRQTVLSMRVIVGKPYRSTPDFSGRVTYLVFNPGWTVPPTIALDDLLPKERKNPDYLQSVGIQVFSGWGPHAVRLNPADVDWSRYGKGHFPFKLYQPPGPTNPLGRVKFIFPNRFGMYLHDTPSRELFSRNVRTFSSGCIRAAKPLQLAAYLLSDASHTWTVAEVKKAIATGATRSVRLPAAVPIYMVYFTAWADKDGTVHFRDDIYGRDRRLAAE